METEQGPNDQTLDPYSKRNGGAGRNRTDDLYNAIVESGGFTDIDALR